MSKEISSLKLKLLKSNSGSDQNEDVEKLKNIINEQNSKIESLMKQTIDTNKAKIIETSQLKIEISKLKVEIETLKNQLEESKKKLNNSENYDKDPKTSLSINTQDDDLVELKNKNKELEEENILLRTELENEKSKEKNDEIYNNENNNKETQKNYENLKEKYNSLMIKMKEGQENIKKANSVLKKVNKYNICISFVSQLIKEMKPSSDKETYLYNKLKSIVEKEDKEKEKEKSGASPEKK